MEDGVLRIEARISAVNVDSDYAEIVIRTDLQTVGRVVQSVGRDCTIALVVHEPVGT
jgi:hypothetical protein